jgi:hypothetical protein
MSIDVNCVWVGSRNFDILQLLSIKQYQKLGFTVNLWAYDHIDNTPDGVIIHDANEIMPHDSIFTFQRPDHFGHGSPCHWSDIFQLKLLNKVGGWYSQLDVTCLKIPQLTEYYFAHHDETSSIHTVNTFIMKIPSKAPFLDKCIYEMETSINRDTISKIDWLHGMRIIGNHVFKNKLNRYISYNNRECANNKTYTKNYDRHIKNLEFIHWCNAVFKDKNNPTPKSLYYNLLENNNLI